MLRNSLKWHFVDQSSKIKILEIACKTKRDDTKRTFDLQMKFLIIYIYASFEGISCSLMVKYDSKSTARSGANCIASTRNWKNRLRYSKYQTLRQQQKSRFFNISTNFQSIRKTKNMNLQFVSTVDSRSIFFATQDSLKHHKT